VSQPYVGQIILVGFNFAPNGWALCQGQVLPITDNETLFNLIGTTYGGDGQTTFALPDLRGRVPIATGTGQSSYVIGQSGGNEAIALTAAQLPPHNHPIDPTGISATPKCKAGAGNQQSPVGNVPAAEAAGVTMTYSNAVPDSNMRAGAVAMNGGTLTAVNTGGNLPHANVQPSLVMNYCISLFGVFPSQT
jgi:microcystin-dependent protein